MLMRFATKPHTRKRAAALVSVGLAVILGSVLSMNMLGPRSAAPRGLTGGVTALSRGYQGVRNQPVSSSKAVATNLIPHSADLNPHSGVDLADADLQYLNSEKLLIPVAGVNSSQLRDTFADARSEGRLHEAIDIAAPRATPVLAAADGTTARLFNSRLGGTTLYEFDKTGRFVFYYAHLSAYADGITEGRDLRKGDVVGYVGDTGNAGPGNFHLHFAISKLDTPWKWYPAERAIDPYPLLAGSERAGR